MAQFKNTTIDSTGRLTLPSGTTAQRPSIPTQGMMRYNTTISEVEYYDGGAWREVSSTGAEATGGLVVDSNIGGISYRSHIFRTNEFAYVSRNNSSSLGGTASGGATVLGEVDSLTSCSPLLTFEQALEFVHSIGCRLPTIDELINEGPAVGTGCGYDNELIWTADKANPEATQHYVMYGRVETNGSATTARDNKSTAYVRYVADINTSRTDPITLNDPIIQGFLEEYYSSDIDLGTKSFTLNVTKGGEVDYLIVGGGGGGGGIIAGGGGAGGYLTGSVAVTPQAYTITVGEGGLGGFGWNSNGQGGLQGADSSAFGLTAIGGGGGGYHGSGGSNNSWVNGGSGGGQGRVPSPGTAVSGQGFPGGTGSGDSGGGGGGAGGPGQDSADTFGGNGGPGLLSNLSGVNTFYAGGGGDGKRSNITSAGIGGIGGGGSGTNYTFRAENAAPHTGGGGGGAGYNGSNSTRMGGTGGSGIVIVRYRKNKETTTAPTIIVNSSAPGIKAFTAQNPAPSAAYITQLGLPNGWYWVNLTGPQLVYVNTQYKGGGWYLVIQNNRDNGNGIGALSYYDATGQKLMVAGSPGNAAGDDLGEINVWAGMELWNAMTNGAGGQVAQVVGNIPMDLDSPAYGKRATWSYTGFDPDYSFQGSTLIQANGGAPGMQSYHSQGTRALTTFDRDQDDNGGNCATYYGNNPFWYGSCWSGNAWGGGSSGGYANAYFWTGSSGDNWNYGATYVRASF